MMMRFSGTVLLLSMLLYLPLANAREGNAIFDSEDKGSLAEQDNPYVEGKKWAETDIKIPPYPDDSDLMDLEVDRPDDGFTYYIDEKSLSVSDKDYVVRYTMVIQSRRGTRNVFYEGIRCNTREYKTYAFGAGKGKLRPRRKPEWKPVTETGYTRFRAHMMQYYFCEWRLPKQRKTIVDKIKYATPGGYTDG
jgi:hypothetical protein